jgi:hypothetical protein
MREILGWMRNDNRRPSAAKAICLRGKRRRGLDGLELCGRGSGKALSPTLRRGV